MKNKNQKTSSSNISDPFVFEGKTHYMQRIADLVRAGHSQYVMGAIPVKKAGFFASKMESAHHTHYSCLVEACCARRSDLRQKLGGGQP